MAICVVTQKTFSYQPMDIASISPITLTPKDLIGSALHKMENEKVYTILVVDKKSP